MNILFGPFGHDSDFITVDKLGALYTTDLRRQASARKSNQIDSKLALPFCKIVLNCTLNFILMRLQYIPLSNMGEGIGYYA